MRTDDQLDTCCSHGFRLVYEPAHKVGEGFVRPMSPECSWCVADPSLLPSPFIPGKTPPVVTTTRSEVIFVTNPEQVLGVPENRVEQIAEAHGIPAPRPAVRHPPGGLHSTKKVIDAVDRVIEEEDSSGRSQG